MGDALNLSGVAELFNSPVKGSRRKTVTPGRRKERPTPSTIPRRKRTSQAKANFGRKSIASSVTNNSPLSKKLYSPSSPILTTSGKSSISSVESLSPSTSLYGRTSLSPVLKRQSGISTGKKSSAADIARSSVQSVTPIRKSSGLSAAKGKSAVAVRNRKSLVSPVGRKLSFSPVAGTSRRSVSSSPLSAVKTPLFVLEDTKLVKQNSSPTVTSGRRLTPAKNVYFSPAVSSGKNSRRGKRISSQVDMTVRKLALTETLSSPATTSSRKSTRVTISSPTSGRKLTPVKMVSLSPSVKLTRKATPKKGLLFSSGRKLSPAKKVSRISIVSPGGKLTPSRVSTSPAVASARKLSAKRVFSSIIVSPGKRLTPLKESKSPVVSSGKKLTTPAKRVSSSLIVTSGRKSTPAKRVSSSPIETSGRKSTPAKRVSYSPTATSGKKLTTGKRASSSPAVSFVELRSPGDEGSKSSSPSPSAGTRRQSSLSVDSGRKSVSTSGRITKSGRRSKSFSLSVKKKTRRSLHNTLLDSLMKSKVNQVKISQIDGFGGIGSLPSTPLSDQKSTRKSRGGNRQTVDNLPLLTFGSTGSSPIQSTSKIIMNTPKSRSSINSFLTPKSVLSQRSGSNRKKSSTNKRVSWSSTNHASSAETTFDFDSVQTPVIALEKLVSPLSTRRKRKGDSWLFSSISESDSDLDMSIKRRRSIKHSSLNMDNSVGSSTEQVKITKTVSKSPKNDLTNIQEVKQLMKTPRMLKSPKNDLTDVYGVKRLLKTPRDPKSPKNDLSDLRGVKRLMTTPRSPKPPKNDLSDVRGLKQLMKSPKIQKSPKNDLTVVVGIRKLMETPRHTKTPRNDLSDVEGVADIMKTPNSSRSSNSKHDMVKQEDISDRSPKKNLQTDKSPRQRRGKSESIQEEAGKSGKVMNSSFFF